METVVNLDGINTGDVKPGQVKTALTKGVHLLRPVKFSAIKAIDPMTGAEIDGEMDINIFFVHAESNEYYGVGKRFGVTGTREGRVNQETGEAPMIGRGYEFAKYLVSSGLTLEAGASLALSAAWADVADTDFKGVETDVLLNGESIVDFLKNSTIRAEVDLSKKGKAYIKAISAA